MLFLHHCVCVRARARKREEKTVYNQVRISPFYSIFLPSHTRKIFSHISMRVIFGDGDENRTGNNHFLLTELSIDRRQRQTTVLFWCSFPRKEFQHRSAITCLARASDDDVYFRCHSVFKSFVVPNVVNRSIMPKKCLQPGKNGIKHVLNVVSALDWMLIADRTSLRRCCFVIGLCNKMLESTTVAVHEGDLFCKQCYARKFVRRMRVRWLVELGFFFLQGPKGVGFGQGAGTLGMDTGEHLGNRSGSEMR